MTQQSGTDRGWVGWRVELVVTSGCLDQLRDLTREMVEAARMETETLDYARFFTAAGDELHLWESYANASAAREHLDMFAHRFEGRFLRLVTRRRCFVYGSCDQALRRRLAPLAPVYLPNAMGFMRGADSWTGG